ncbi:MAG TPA: hypothetical protein VMA36_04720 [Candidatus Limnocylindria bacterium]|jgi:hypothetical protein|nr:hypothetical protein [Candidatus Limnocylindria bacterium]
MNRRPAQRSRHLVRRLTHALVWVVLAIFVFTSVGVLWAIR